MSILSDILQFIFGGAKKSRAQVEKELTEIGNSRGLDPLHSIVDLLKAANLDSSMNARRALHVESGGKAEEYEGTSDQNIKLHAYVMDKIASGYGDVPDKG